MCSTLISRDNSITKKFQCHTSLKITLLVN